MVEQQGDAFARQQLVALLEARLRRRRGAPRALLEHAHALDQREHAVAVGLEAVAAGGEVGLDMCHAWSFPSFPS